MRAAPLRDIAERASGEASIILPYRRAIRYAKRWPGQPRRAGAKATGDITGEKALVDWEAEAEQEETLTAREAAARKEATATPGGQAADGQNKIFDPGGCVPLAVAVRGAPEAEENDGARGAACDAACDTAGAQEAAQAEQGGDVYGELDEQSLDVSLDAVRDTATSKIDN